jgi:hypothetical protein
MGALVQSVLDNDPSLMKDVAGPQAPRKILAVLIERCEWLIASLSTTFDGTITQQALLVRRKSEFLLALTSFVSRANSEDLTGAVLSFLISTSIDVFFGYPSLFTKQRAVFTRALCLLVLSLQSKGAAVQAFLEKVIPICLARTISRVESKEYLTQALINPATGEFDQRLLAVYIPLWKELLEPEDQRTRRHIFQTGLSNSYGSLARQLFDSLMNECLTLTNSLSLEYSSIVRRIGESIKEEIVPKNPVDHELFINLVTFLEFLIPLLNPFLLVPWIPLLFQRFEKLCYDYPLVSSSYRLNGTLFELVNRTRGVSAEFDALNFMLSTKEYVLHVAAQCVQFRDELLASTVSMVLRAPIGTIPLNQLLPVITLALRTGLTFLPLAVIAMNNLELWLSDKYDELLACSKTIVQLLEPYLSSKVKDVAREAKNMSKNEQKDRPGTEMKQNIKKTELEEIKNFQKRVLFFVGRLGGHSHGMLMQPDAALSSVLQWSTNVQLKIEFPVSSLSLSLSITLDFLLPRVIQVSVP